LQYKTQQDIDTRSRIFRIHLNLAPPFRVARTESRHTVVDVRKLTKENSVQFFYTTRKSL